MCCCAGTACSSTSVGASPSKAPAATSPSSLRRPFTRSGAQVTFCLLAWPELAGRPVRELARASGTAVGGAHAARHDLESGGYLIAGSSGHVLTRAGELLNRWTEAYALTLSSSLHLGYYPRIGPRLVAACPRRPSGGGRLPRRGGGRQRVGQPPAASRCRPVRAGDPGSAPGEVPVPEGDRCRGRQRGGSPQVLDGSGRREHGHRCGAGTCRSHLCRPAGLR